MGQIEDILSERRYSSAEVAKAYGVSSRTVVEWIHSGQLEAMKLGRQYFTTASALKTMEKLAKFKN